MLNPIKVKPIEFCVFCNGQIKEILKDKVFKCNKCNQEYYSIDYAKSLEK
jgi:ribosomal protein L37AE/L43A